MKMRVPLMATVAGSLLSLVAGATTTGGEEADGNGVDSEGLARAALLELQRTGVQERMYSVQCRENVSPDTTTNKKGTRT